MTSGGVTEASGRPATWPYRTVVMAAQVLPPGELRDRYRREFVAELYGMGRRQQAVHAIQVLSKAWALRVAVTSQSRSSAKEIDMTLTTRRPLTCMLNLHHRWRVRSTEDGARFRQCTRCGKDKSGSPNGPGDWAAGVNAGGVGGS